MGEALPREYDRLWSHRISDRVRNRVGYSHDAGSLTRFLVQLEYSLDASWAIVVRYDHDTAGPDEMTHDVAADGVHMDVYRDGVKVGTEQITGPIAPAEGFTAAEEHLAQHREAFIDRFEAWHKIDRTDE